MFQEKQLAQKRENSTNAVSVLQASTGTTVVKTIIIANTGNAATYRLFHDDDGTTYDESTALFWDVGIAKNSTIQIDTFVAMDDPTGNFAYRSSIANALTITIYGSEITT